MKTEIEELSPKETMKKYPCLTAHIIAESLGYATPSRAAGILKDAREGRKNHCEWIYSCYASDPLEAVRDSIRNRHHHRGFMCDYRLAHALVKKAIETGVEPLFGSWF
ncbi:MAG: hypothetical protein ACFFDT_03425 [Candidatus Hodarchaeota archaeon]